MVDFRYQSITTSGEAKNGVLKGRDRADIIQQLSSRGETATKVEKAKAADKLSRVSQTRKKRLSKIEMSAMIRSPFRGRSIDRFYGSPQHFGSPPMQMDLSMARMAAISPVVVPNIDDQIALNTQMAQMYPMGVEEFLSEETPPTFAGDVATVVGAVAGAAKTVVGAGASIVGAGASVVRGVASAIDPSPVRGRSPPVVQRGETPACHPVQVKMKIPNQARLLMLKTQNQARRLMLKIQKQARRLMLAAQTAQVMISSILDRTHHLPGESLSFLISLNRTLVGPQRHIKMPMLTLFLSILLCSKTQSREKSQAMTK